ncbi:MAG TPA: hypothetical protein VJ843_05535 [Candidatus Saccharimonadales bacterium]|nr:hypothetical protein [Candidatus Saccharimonadales bacterium]
MGNTKKSWFPDIVAACVGSIPGYLLGTVANGVFTNSVPAIIVVPGTIAGLVGFVAMHWGGGVLPKRPLQAFSIFCVVVMLMVWLKA